MTPRPPRYIVEFNDETGAALIGIQEAREGFGHQDVRPATDSDLLDLVAALMLGRWQKGEAA